MSPHLITSIVVAALLTGCTAETTSPESDSVDFPESPLYTLTTDQGDLTIEVRTAPKQPPSRGQIDVELTIAGTDGAPRDDLSLSALPWMPAMGHGSSIKPKIVAKGGGRYEVLHVAMFMAGEWELRTQIAGPVEDSATIDFQIP